MQRSSKFIALSLAVMLLAGCSLIKRVGDDTGAEPATPAATPVKPAKPGKPAKGEKKPAQQLERPADKGDPQQRFNEAMGFMKGGQSQEAEQSFTWLTQDFPDFAGPWTNLGIIYAKSNRNPQAIAAFVKAVNINDDDATAFNWLGILYRQAHDYQRAEDSYKSAIKARSDFGLAHLNLGILYDEYERRPDLALPHYKEYLKLGGQDDLRVQAWVAKIEHPDVAAGTNAGPTKGMEEKP